VPASDVNPAISSSATNTKRRFDLKLDVEREPAEFEISD
jgi:hypothetical protein